jgi:hypothetical protein
MFDTYEPTVVALPDIQSNLAAGCYDTIWASEGTRQRKRAALNKAVKVFRAYAGIIEPEDIPTSRAEVEFFYDKHISGQPLKVKSGLKSPSKAQKWKDEYCTVCDVASGRRDFEKALREQEDDWKALVDFLLGAAPGEELCNPFELICIRSLARESRERGISIAGLDAPSFGEMTEGVSLNLQNTLVDALSLLVQLRKSSALPEHLAPTIELSDICVTKTLLKRSTPEMHSEFQRLSDKYVSDRLSGRMVRTFGSEARTVEIEPISTDRANNIRTSLRWYWHGLVGIGAASQSSFDPAILGRPALLADVIDACKSGALGPVISTQTRRDQPRAVVGFLSKLDPAFRGAMPDDFYSINSIAKERETEGKRLKRKACLAFIDDDDAQRTFFRLPQRFYEQAKPMIENFHTLAHPDSGQISMAQNRALELAVMAAITAINTRFPSRLATLQRLTIGGAMPHVLFPESGDGSKSVVLDIPGNIVKNRRHASGIMLTPAAQGDPRTILSWFIEDVHPLVVRLKHKHDRLRQPNLLFAGLTTNTLRRYWRSHILDTDLRLTPHMCRHFIASLLRSRGVSIEEIAALLCITPAVAAETYAFVEVRAVIQEVMSAQNEIFAKLGV